MLLNESFHDLGPSPNPRTATNYIEIALALGLLAAGLLGVLIYWMGFNKRQLKITNRNGTTF